MRLVQPVGATSALATAGSPTYRKWHDALLKYRHGRFDNPVPCARRDLADLLPDRDGRVVSARAHGLDAVPRAGRTRR